MEIKAAQFLVSLLQAVPACRQVLPVKEVVEFWRSASPRCCQVPPSWFPGQRPQLGGTTPPVLPARGWPHRDIRWDAYACALGRLTPPHSQPPSLQSNWLWSYLPSSVSNQDSRCGAMRRDGPGFPRCKATRLPEAPQPRVPSLSCA